MEKTVGLITDFGLFILSMDITGEGIPLSVVRNHPWSLYFEVDRGKYREKYLNMVTNCRKGLKPPIVNEHSYKIYCF